MKGQKTGGRQKGAPNQLVKSAREVFKTTLEGQVEHIQDAFEKVRKTNPEKYLELFAKYAQYFMPKQVDITTGGEQVKQIFKIGGQEIEL